MTTTVSAVSKSSWKNTESEHLQEEISDLKKKLANIKKKRQVDEITVDNLIRKNVVLFYIAEEHSFYVTCMIFFFKPKSFYKFVVVW